MYVCIVTTWTFIAVARSHRKARANVKPKSENCNGEERRMNNTIHILYSPR